MKLEAKGAAACIQGYPALEGLGMTRIRNHNVDRIPSPTKRNLAESFDLSRF